MLKLTHLSTETALRIDPIGIVRAGALLDALHLAAMFHWHFCHFCFLSTTSEQIILCYITVLTLVILFL